MHTLFACQVIDILEAEMGRIDSGMYVHAHMYLGLHMYVGR